MTALIVDHAGGRCDSRCHEATHAGCDCICGGTLHGAGSSTAAQARLQQLVAGGALGARPARVMRDLWDRVERVEMTGSDHQLVDAETSAAIDAPPPTLIPTQAGPSNVQGVPLPERPSPAGSHEPEDRAPRPVAGACKAARRGRGTQTIATPEHEEAGRGAAPGRRLCTACGKYLAGGPWVRHGELCAKCRGVA